ncbi:ribosome-associated translation inhibitor RaiA [Aerococcus christensenii]|uniref:Ribosome hibernation promoting factor n=1 Tax=Aerococcus christensenii TaxID=87541 RepID=A0A0X8F7H8_9LACT|nr:ribosome-associated translation inhibitor RaiA [Aerococcus christensenii]AMB92237.1 Fis family transcriptional regulator [Aerococcus christensenii]KXB37811.1 ribosomal subunit interface protein [Aerococcus christensenii]MDK8233301.1 ribosome-associated translation inhibitor RaiA [Aerococcus christensenii]PKY92035.1 ribosome-associated translation inhibitor RaiA [Aerococcus christensenii]WEB70835.1 ribosome-associated translation inhibitor RaiA [Aerococcus christensenii]
MFTYNVRGENIKITPAIRQYAENKISRVEKYFKDTPEATVHVNAKVYQDGNAKVEVTIPLPRLTLRAEEISQDLYGSIDLVVDKLERQMKKYKTRINRKSREKGIPEAIFHEVGNESNDSDNEIAIVRSKSISVKPMSAEEAVLQMEMLGHSFFIFENSEDETISLVYKRRNGKYGLIAIEEEFAE